ncbi:histone-like nucleoid-structuring protein Lsr2 [Kibdelosporangium lantanae]|uniref:Histone-like nucleoid-structuring protein Lsr2 n=1 Tax=Kibdelosporangium lantanae TaxID=1497396 RepID=A0ABW3M517_9PSEU
MATKIILVDDLDHAAQADETVTFALDGTDYAIDLSEENASRLRACGCRPGGVRR